MPSSKKRAIVAFVPVVHDGYVKFFRENKGPLSILGKDILDDYTSITRDLRVMDPEVTRKIILSLESVSDVFVVGKKEIGDIIADVIVMPDEDVSRDVAAKYLKDREIIFVPTFLRWDKQISTTEFIVPPDRVISTDEFHKELMRKALTAAQKSADWWRQIGGLISKNGEVLYVGFNKNIPSSFYIDTFGDPRSNFDAGIRIDLVTTIHAEANIIASAARDGKSLKGSDIYTTTFPCPTCARLITQAGIKRVYYHKGYSMLDAEMILKGAGIEIILVKEV